MLRTIDHYNGHDIQKVTNARGETIRYQTVLHSSVGDASAVVQHKTLLDARLHINQPKPKMVAVNVPKALLPHNQKGYRADKQRTK